jgi:hypothetical protein
MIKITMTTTKISKVRAIACLIFPAGANIDQNGIAPRIILISGLFTLEQFAMYYWDYFLSPFVNA